MSNLRKKYMITRDRNWGGNYYCVDPSNMKYVGVVTSHRNVSQLGTCWAKVSDRDMVFGDGCPQYTGKIIKSKKSASYKRFWYTTKLARFVRS